MIEDDNEYKKASLRANAIEKKRLDITVGNLDKAKRNLAADMRKSQASYRRRLKQYRDRQKEILMSRAPVPPTTASVGEFLLRQLTSRQSQNRLLSASTNRRPQTAIPTSRAKLMPLLNLHRESSVFKGSASTLHKPSSTSSARADQDGKILHEFETNMPSSVDDIRQNSSQCHSQSSQAPAFLPPSCKTRPKTASFKNQTNGIFPISKTSAAKGNTAKEFPKQSSTYNVSSSLTSKQRPKTVSTITFNHREPAKDTAYPRVDLNIIHPVESNGGLCGSSASSEYGISEFPDNDDPIMNEAQRVQEEYEANVEFGKASKRQRSKVDLRPSTAWGRLYGIESSCTNKNGVGRQATTSHAHNPFTHMKGSLGGPSRQVRYFDNDEIEERGAFYRFLLENRLEREHTRFQDICDKVNQFCNVSCDAWSDSDTQSDVEN